MEPSSPNQESGALTRENRPFPGQTEAGPMPRPPTPGSTPAHPLPLWWCCSRLPQLAVTAICLRHSGSQKDTTTPGEREGVVRHCGKWLPRGHFEYGPAILLTHPSPPPPPPPHPPLPHDVLPRLKHAPREALHSPIRHHVTT